MPCVQEKHQRELGECLDDPPLISRAGMSRLSLGCRMSTSGSSGSTICTRTAPSLTGCTSTARWVLSCGILQYHSPVSPCSTYIPMLPCCSAIPEVQRSRLLLPFSAAFLPAGSLGGAAGLPTPPDITNLAHFPGCRSRPVAAWAARCSSTTAPLTSFIHAPPPFPSPQITIDGSLGGAVQLNYRPLFLLPLMLPSMSLSADHSRRQPGVAQYRSSPPSTAFRHCLLHCFPMPSTADHGRRQPGRRGAAQLPIFRRRHKLGGRAAPRQARGSLRLLLCQRHRAGSPGAAQVPPEVGPLGQHALLSSFSLFLSIFFQGWRLELSGVLA
jgi:hypothetical protein